MNSKKPLGLRVKKWIKPLKERVKNKGYEDSLFILWVFDMADIFMDVFQALSSRAKISVKPGVASELVFGGSGRNLVQNNPSRLTSMYATFYSFISPLSATTPRLRP